MTCCNFANGGCLLEKEVGLLHHIWYRNDEKKSKQLPGRGSMVAGCTDENKVWWEVYFYGEPIVRDVMSNVAIHHAYGTTFSFLIS